MQSKTLQANVGAPSRGRASSFDKLRTGEKRRSRRKGGGSAGGGAPLVGAGKPLWHGHKDVLARRHAGYQSADQIGNQFKAIEELKEKKKALDDILKEAEEQNAVYSGDFGGNRWTERIY
jgi:hypothetical protein